MHNFKMGDFVTIHGQSAIVVGMDFILKYYDKNPGTQSWYIKYEKDNPSLFYVVTNETYPNHFIPITTENIHRLKLNCKEAFKSDLETILK